MTGSTPYLNEKSSNFERSFKKLVKSYKSRKEQENFVNLISHLLEDELSYNPYPIQARNEPLPNGLKLPFDWRFYKLVIVVAKGASGQVRLMYLVNENERIIKPLWIYNHQQFTKRPPDQDLKNIINEIFTE